MANLLTGNCWKAVTAAFALAAYLLALALASSPSLHAAIHHDAGHENHECAVVTLSNEHVVSVTPIIFVPAKFQVAQIANHECMYSVSLGSSFLSSEVLEHAPPLVVAG